MKLWSEVVKAKAGNKCEYCGKTEYLNAHHIFSRSHFSTRYDHENGLCLCSGHHSLNTDSAHKDPFFIISIIGRRIRTKEFLLRLERRAKTPCKIDRALLEIELKQELKKYVQKPLS